MSEEDVQHALKEHTVLKKYKGHTPGPWKPSRADMLSFNGIDGVQESFVYRGDEETATSRIRVRPYADGDFDPVADARLIADAPSLVEQNDSLLDVLQKIRIAAWGQCCTEGISTKTETYHPARIYRLAAAAIKKAEI